MVFCKHGREVPKSQIAFSCRAFHETIEFRVVTRAVVYGVWSNVEFYGRGAAQVIAILGFSYGPGPWYLVGNVS